MLLSDKAGPGHGTYSSLTALKENSNTIKKVKRSLKKENRPVL